MSSHTRRATQDKPAALGSARKQQLSSFILFASVILFVNLCPFHQEFQYLEDEINPEVTRAATTTTTLTTTTSALEGAKRLHSMSYSFSENCLRFVRLMFTNPVRLGKRTTRSIQADAAMIGKMAKVWYIKKKIKKLGKKLKKHTIAVPVFTAIPIYEHSYYPQHPHVQHMSHHHQHLAAAASSPAYTATAAASQLEPQASSTIQQLATSASGRHQQQVMLPRWPSMQHHHHHHQQHQAARSMYPHPNAAAAAAASNQIINAYQPSPPLYVDESGGLYGHYGNAYGRYDGGYQLW